ncbi:DUF3352 domain-containing protein, partial [Candidatus Poribacteria bacterium]
GKIADLVNSLNIPDVPPVSIAPLLGQMVGAGVGSLMDLENGGFDTKGELCIFWTSMAFDKFSIALQVNSRERAEEAVRSLLAGTDGKHRGMTYVVSEGQFAWAFLDDVLVYSKDKTAVMETINTHLKEKPSILHDEKYLDTVEGLRSGDISVYVGLDTIASTFLPLLKLQAEKTKKELAEQMKKQSAATPDMPFDPAKMLGMEIDMGMWLLQQLRSYSISVGIGRDGIWTNDSLKFKPDSPVCSFLNIRPSELKLIESLPSDVMMAGGATIDAESLERFNSIMLDLFLPAMQEEMTAGQMAELREIYVTVTHDILSCLGDEVAFAVMTKSDKMMPRVVYILEVVDKAKAQETLGNLTYIMEMSRPFYKAFGMDVQMTEGPTQRYTGIQIESFQMDLSKMAELVPNGAAIYPEQMFLWYTFVDDKMIYAMSQSANTIKTAIDAVKGRSASITNSPGFEDIDIRLPERKNAILYISPTGYLSFVMGIVISQMGQKMPAGAMDTMEPNMGFAVATNLDGDGIRNLNYFLVKEIQSLVNTVVGFSQMMKPNQQ